MATDEFQEETKKSASNWGKNIGNTVSGAAEGLEATLNNKSITKLAEKSGIILGGGIKAISKGLEESIDKQKVFADKEIEKDGIYIGRAEWIASSADKKSSFTLYLEFKKDFKGSLKLTVYDNDGKKIDNAIIEVDEKSGEEKLFVFDFSYLDPTLSEYCILTKK